MCLSGTKQLGSLCTVVQIGAVQTRCYALHNAAVCTVCPENSVTLVDQDCLTNIK